jgi:hypothetical protein
MNIDITYSFLSGYDEFWEDNPPVVVKVCHCEQCRSIRDNRKNRAIKKKMKRLFNKRRRSDKHNGEIVFYYWA